ncbi:MAG: type III-B CRISPR-associated protein Cas10/Cmr2, partial [Deltaproteobacteria bacterium RIFOXYD12_FULL_50_9]
MTKFGQNTDYWVQKIIMFLHDPPDKPLRLQGHEERSGRLLDILGLQANSLNHEIYAEADRIASGMDRATLPSFNEDGFVDFLLAPKITHPTGKDGSLAIELPAGFDPTQVQHALEELLKSDIGMDADQDAGYSGMFKGLEEKFAPARFNYLYFVLRRRLAQENIGGLGGLWPRLPAATRIPDHSIWQHNGLVSALGSCFACSPKQGASLMVFGITPVQDFIERARKLRDFWTGSVLLSWLAFEGIKKIMLEFGADHVLYPSLHGQPLVDDWLASDSGLKMKKLLAGINVAETDNSGIATFPNKFVFLAPQGKEQEIASMIEAHIRQQWLELGDSTLHAVEKGIQHPDTYLREQFNRQIGSYWDFHWAACPMADAGEKDILAELLHEDTYKINLALFEDSKKIFKTTDSRGYLYPVTHALTQTCMAAGKSHRGDQRPPEPGIKCDLFGEYEALRFAWKEGEDRNPPPSQDPFWSKLREKWPNKVEFKKTERLCAIALMKRLAYKVCTDWKDHPLQRLFRKADSFPSSTETALTDWFEAARRASKAVAPLTELSKAGSVEWQKKLAQYFHACGEEGKNSGKDEPEISELQKEEKRLADKIFGLCQPKSTDSYYAILMMDGDRMGKLVNGETIAASWGTVLHPKLVKRFGGPFSPRFKDFWQERLSKKRLLAPAVHAAISEALGDFALLTVPEIIKNHGGRLIYAGGDDVCAVLPVSTVLDAARKIAEAYGAGFRFQPDSQQKKCVTLGASWRPQPGKLMVHLGHGDELTISAGILVCHHKKPLKSALQRAHQLLGLAKNDCGRNAFALEVDKRSGGGRIFKAKWHQADGATCLLDHFLTVCSALGSEQSGEQLSSSLAYRLQEFHDGLLAMATDKPELLPKLIAAQLGRSGKSDKDSDNQK